jgi:hypothetical protein
MGSWYWIGVSAGLGAAAGILIAAALGAGVRVVVVSAGVAAALAGLAVGYGIDQWQPGGWGDVVLAAAGAVLGLLAAVQTVGGAIRRGGTRAATGVLVGGAALVVAALAWIPAAGYLIVLALPALTALLRRARPERYAGLRTLARDE